MKKQLYIWIGVLSVLTALASASVDAKERNPRLEAALRAPLLASSAFYVSPTGSDSNAGTLAAPFLTLGKCQTAMQGSSTKTCYIRAGSYALPTVSNCAGGTTTCGLDLGSSDNGETWSYYPPDGVNSASLTGGSTGSGTGLWSMIRVDNTTNLTVNGLSLHNFQYGGIVSGGGTSGLIAVNNIIYNGYYVPGSASNPAGFSCFGCGSTIIAHNVIHDIASFGISNVNVNGNISNLLVTGNVLYNTCTSDSDCGAIYLQDQNATATGLEISYNYIHDGNTAATLSSGYGEALYLDDCTSNVSAFSNIFSGRNGSNTVLVHGGNNITLTRNLTDLATYQQSIAAYQTSSGTGCSAGTMSGNTYTNSVIIGTGGGGGYNLLSGTPGNSPRIQNNDYYNYSGTSISSGGSYSDANPVNQDPLLSGWNYAVYKASAVYGGPVNWTNIPANWGPPGYSVPQSGSVPSSPHITRNWQSAEVSYVNQTNVVYTIPTGKSAAVGDVIVVMAATKGTLTAPSTSGVTWTQQVADRFTSYNYYLYVFTGVVTSTQSAGTTYTFTAGATSFANGIMASYSGVDTSTVVDTSQSIDSQSTGQKVSVTNSVTLGYSGDMLLSFGSTASGGETYFNTAGFNTILNDGSSGLWYFDQTYGNTGATGGITTGWGMNDQYGAFLLALKAI